MSADKDVKEVTEEVQVAEGAVPPDTVASKVIWNDRNMVSTYTNVSNVATTSDEIMLLFGTSQAWNSTQKEVVVDLSHRMIMTPTAAKRFQIILTRTLEEYDKKFGGKG